MKRYIARHCIILMDDLEREEERRIGRQWADATGPQLEIHGVEKPYGCVRLESERKPKI